MRWWEELQGPLLGRYRVEKLLGQGGMAEVLLAHDERFEGRRVAIKAPTLDSFAPNQLAELLLRFQREVQRQGSEPIAGVVPIIDAGEVTDAQGKSQPFLVMDYLSGGSLGDALGGSSGRRERTQTLVEVMEWLRPVATTLDRLHTRKYLHRDVKPDNILFNADGDPFLSDFGISTSLDDIAGAGTMMSVLGSVGPGSPGYQSPESLRGDKLAASDQFSLAVTAYEALTGRLPMVANTRDAWIAALANWSPTPIAKLCPELPAAAAAVLMRAISVEPRDRYLSCSAFAQALTEAVTAPARTPAEVAAVAPVASVAPPIAAAVAPEAPAPRAPQRSLREKMQAFAVYGAIVLIVLTAGAIMLGNWIDAGKNAVATRPDDKASAAQAPASSKTPVATGPVIKSKAIADSEGVIAPDGSVVGEVNTITLEKAALAMQAIDNEANFARSAAEADAKAILDGDTADNKGHRKAIASSLAASEKSRDAALVAANVAEFIGRYMAVSEGRGGSLLPFALDITQRADDYARMPPYVAWQGLDKDLPMDPRIKDVVLQTTKARERAELAAEKNKPVPPADTVAAGAQLRRRLGSGRQFELQYENIRISGPRSKPVIDTCTTSVRFGGAVDSPKGPLWWNQGRNCPTDRFDSLNGEINVAEAKGVERVSFKGKLSDHTCRLSDDTACPDWEDVAAMPIAGALDLVTGKLLLVGMTQADGGGSPMYFLLSRSSDRPIDGEPGPDAAASSP